MRLDPASAFLTNPSGEQLIENGISDAETIETETEFCDLLLGLRPIKQVIL